VILVALLFFFAAAPNRNTEKFWKNRRIINTSKNRKESQSTDFVNAKTSNISVSTIRMECGRLWRGQQQTGHLFPAERSTRYYPEAQNEKIYIKN
jgi:hypothetical protein